jgi:BirA family biotin operon repressor/biotin-[acetyl-CoA-carboxylase] ligase
MLKWPNDILIGDAKLGGILVEIDGDFGGPVSAVVGIGLNVDMPAELAAGITQPWVDLNSLYGMAVSRNQLAAKVIMSCHEVFSGLSDSSFSIFKDEWNSLHALQGQHVSTEAGGQVLLGVACGVDDTGALLIDSDGVVHRVVGGEVTVRRIQ